MNEPSTLQSRRFPVELAYRAVQRLRVVIRCIPKITLELSTGSVFRADEGRRRHVGHSPGCNNDNGDAACNPEMLQLFQCIY